MCYRALRNLSPEPNQAEEITNSYRIQIVQVYILIQTPYYFFYSLKDCKTIITKKGITKKPIGLINNKSRVQGGGGLIKHGNR